MRLGVFIDYRFRRDGDVLTTERAFALFLFALAERVDALTLLGRLDPEPGRFPYAVPDTVGFAPLPWYASLAHPLAALRGLGSAARAGWRALDDLDAVWLLGPHPLGIVLALLAILRRKRVVLGVRQDLPTYTRTRHPGRRAFLAAALVLEGVWRLLALVRPVVVVGPDLARRYRHGRRVLAILVSLVHEREVVPADAPPAAGARRLLTVGRLDTEKNPLLLADIVAGLGDGWSLAVCGDGPQAGALRERLDTLGVGDAVTLHGYVPRGGPLERLYADADAFLHVSWTEGMPQVLIEAWAAGLPTVATAVGGVPALAGDAALLVPPGDADAAITALRRLDADDDLRATLVDRGRTIVLEHTIEAETARVAAFIAGR